MKLRNKKTGEIKYLQEVIHQVYQDHNLISLNKLNEEWEDYEERKYDGLHIAIMKLADFIQNDPNEDKVDLEDCVKVLRKLEAWRRLKYNCGISFSGLNRDRCGKPVSVNLEFDKEGRATFDEAVQNVKDLTLLFGGE